jgi:hypothetical protein
MQMNATNPIDNMASSLGQAASAVGAAAEAQMSKVVAPGAVMSSQMMQAVEGIAKGINSNQPKVGVEALFARKNSELMAFAGREVLKGISIAPGEAAIEVAPAVSIAGKLATSLGSAASAIGDAANQARSQLTTAPRGVESAEVMKALLAGASAVSSGLSTAVNPQNDSILWGSDGINNAAEFAAVQAQIAAQTGSPSQFAPGLDDKAFVTLAYEKHLGRQPEAKADGSFDEGPTAWVNALATGAMTRADVDRGISTSPEAQSATPFLMRSDISAPQPAPSGAMLAHQLAKVGASLSAAINQVGAKVSESGTAATGAAQDAFSKVSALLSAVGALMKNVSASTRKGSLGDQPISIARDFNQDGLKFDSRQPMPALERFRGLTDISRTARAEPESMPISELPGFKAGQAELMPMPERRREVMPTPEQMQLASDLVVGRTFSSFASDGVPAYQAIQNLMAENGINIRSVRGNTADGPGAMITMDMRVDRLNLHLSDDGTINRANIG